MQRISSNFQDIEKRIMNFEEVISTYTKEEAIKEASRCLNCQNPRCVKGCPVNIEIPKFIENIKNDDIENAYKIINDANLFPSICGRVCPQEKQCEKMCIKGFRGEAIAIGALERYVGDNYIDNQEYDIVENGKNIAIVGSGPSGLSAAGTLRKKGYNVTIYESLFKEGGVLIYGIPEFRLPKKIVEKEISKLKKLGVKFVLNTVIGKTITIEELKEKFDAIYIASGAGLPKFMNLEGENANGVFSANEILTRINLMKSYNKNSNTPLYVGKEVIVVGAGNVACDAARSIRRMGSNVKMIYRRDIEDINARKEEIDHALEEGIELITLTNPVRIITNSNNDIEYLEVEKMNVVGKDENKKSIIESKKNSKYNIKCDMIIIAIGTDINSIVLNDSDIKNNKGLIITNDFKTNNEKVFAGGDCVSGSATVIKAMEHGKKAAKKIDDYLNGR